MKLGLQSLKFKLNYYGLLILLKTKLESTGASIRFLIANCNVGNFFTLFDKLGFLYHITPLDNWFF